MVTVEPGVWLVSVRFVGPMTWIVAASIASDADGEAGPLAGWSAAAV